MKRRPLEAMVASACRITFWKPVDFRRGCVLAVWWIPPDQIILRKLEAVQSLEAFDRTMDEFGEALRAAGYDTDEKVIELVREIKREQARIE
jgi:hypothetical protein